MRGSRANKQIKQLPFVEHLINQPVGVRENEKMSHKLMVLTQVKNHMYSTFSLEIEVETSNSNQCRYWSIARKLVN